jgi:hypothetical protein
MSPERPEAIAMPAEHRLRLRQQNGVDGSLPGVTELFMGILGGPHSATAWAPRLDSVDPGEPWSHGWTSNADDTWFALSHNGDHDSSADLTLFGVEVVENPTYGLLALARPQTAF